MTSRSVRRQRSRGTIDELPSGGLRVRVYAGVDPLSKRRIDLRETVPAGPRAKAEAEKVLTRLLNQVDEKTNPRTKATVNQLLDRWFDMLDAETSTRRGYRAKIDKHIRPVLGQLQVGRVDAETLESFYADLRRCRDHCGGRTYVDHRTTQEHACDEHKGTPCEPARPDCCAACRRRCRDHVCSGLADSSIRQVHWILSAAFGRAVRWRWIAVNPADQATPPRVPQPNPQPPTTAEAAQLAEAAWSRDPAWGSFVWLAMTSGARRGELCALRWSDVDLSARVIHLHRSLYVDDDGDLREKHTKTHQQRRVVLDEETVAVLADHSDRCLAEAEALDTVLAPEAYVFSLATDHGTPLVPDTASQRFDRMARSLGIKTTLHKLRHYSATELITAGVDVRTIAGRLGHSGGGATTLRVYAAWTSEADQRAASRLSGRMPQRVCRVDRQTGQSVRATNHVETDDAPAKPYQRISAHLRGAIACGALQRGAPVPTGKELAASYQVSLATAHRAVSVLVHEGLVTASRGRRVVVV